jgi:hypothetical protein
MPRRYLIGPVSISSQVLPRDSGCLCTFGLAGNAGVDIVARAAGSWEGICSRLPGSWAPDCLVLSQALALPLACSRRPFRTWR